MLVIVVADGAIAVEPVLQDCRRLEYHHTPRRDRYFRAGLRIASDPLTLLPHNEGAERRSPAFRPVKKRLG